MFYTKEELKGMKGVNSKNAGQRYRLKQAGAPAILVDNQRGYGHCTLHSTPFFKGFICSINIKTFLRLAVPKGGTDLALDALPEETRHVLDLIQQQAYLTNPILYLNVDSFFAEANHRSKAYVTGYEGYAIAQAINFLGFQQLPIQFVLVGVNAALTKNDPGFYTYLNQGILDYNRKISYPQVFKRLIQS